MAALWNKAIIDKISEYKFIPARLALTDFVYIRDESLQLDGFAFEIKDINEFKIFLSKTNFFNEVDLKDRVPEKLEQKNVQRFRFICYLKKS